MSHIEIKDPQRLYRPLEQSWQTFSVKGWLVNILGFADYMVSVTTTQLCCNSAKAVMGNM